MVLEQPVSARTVRGHHRRSDLTCDDIGRGVRARGELTWTPSGVDRFEITRDGTVLGYVDHVGSVFVCLQGAWYSVATEARQTLDFDDAIAWFGGTAA